MLFSCMNFLALFWFSEETSASPTGMQHGRLLFFFQLRMLLTFSLRLCGSPTLLLLWTDE